MGVFFSKTLLSGTKCILYLSDRSVNRLVFILDFFYESICLICFFFEKRENIFFIKYKRAVDVLY